MALQFLGEEDDSQLTVCKIGYLALQLAAPGRHNLRPGIACTFPVLHLSDGPASPFFRTLEFPSRALTVASHPVAMAGVARCADPGKFWLLVLLNILLLGALGYWACKALWRRRGNIWL
jgi:hypothetical protein